MNEKTIITCVLAYASVLRSLPLSECPYDYYKVDGEVGCTPCPICPEGEGMDKICIPYIPYLPKDAPRCVKCVDGATFSDFKSTSVCDFCSEKDTNQREERNCTRFQDRVSVCKRGYFENGAHGGCTQKCCHCNRRHRRYVKKCEQDGMPYRRFCAPEREDGKCHE